MKEAPHIFVHEDSVLDLMFNMSKAEKHAFMFMIHELQQHRQFNRIKVCQESIEQSGIDASRETIEKGFRSLLRREVVRKSKFRSTYLPNREVIRTPLDSHA